jgi:hypothetical protein
VVIDDGCRLLLLQDLSADRCPYRLSGQSSNLFQPLALMVMGSNTCNDTVLHTRHETMLSLALADYLLRDIIFAQCLLFTYVDDNIATRGNMCSALLHLVPPIG